MPSPEHPTHGISRDSLSPRVRSYDDNLDTQVRDLFDKYHLSHYDQDVLAKAIEDRTVSLVDAHHLRDLLAQRDHIRRTGELPPEAKNNLEFQLQEAREILGPKNVYGPDEVNRVFETALSLKDLPPIPYSPEDLEKAKELGMKLILRISHDAEGTPLTPQRMYELLESRLTAEERRKLFFQNPATAWYKDEPFFTTETPVSSVHPHPTPSPIKGEGTRYEWKLVTTDILPGSTQRNYFFQTVFLRDKLAELGWLTFEEAEEVIDKKLEEIRPLLESEGERAWRKATRLLSELLLNQRHRRTVPQAVYDTLLVYFSKPDRAKRPLRTTYDMTQSRSSDGQFLHFGFGGGEYVSFGRWYPQDLSIDIGVCLSR